MFIYKCLEYCKVFKTVNHMLMRPPVPELLMKAWWHATNQHTRQVATATVASASCEPRAAFLASTAGEPYR